MDNNKTIESSTLKEQHQHLSAVIKGLHRQLRRAYRESNGDHASVWENHTQNSDGLKEYAQAMHSLATEHWEKHPDTRIKWCGQVALEYFDGGGLQLAQQRDLRKRMRHSFSKMERNMNGSNKEETETQKIRDSTYHAPDEHCSFPPQKVENSEVKTRYLEMSSAVNNSCIRLLDVGSCYNPFEECPEFEAVGLDLIPATESVYQCDFLKLEVAPRVPYPHHASPSLNEILNIAPGSRKVTQLPEASFQVVVFSLLLEYLPAAAQRWTCCVKAHALLELQGLLLIVTPDSNSAYRNAPMIKSWRQALEHIGFQRWKYNKMAHIHCMAYRKVTEKVPEKFPHAVENLLYIPQDFNDACFDDDHLPLSERESRSTKVVNPEQQAEIEKFFHSSVGELPLMMSDGEEEEGN